MKLYINFQLRILLILVFVYVASVIPVSAGYLYVLNQQNGTPNQIYCFAVTESTGTLVPVAGFPVATGGNGTIGTQSELLTIDRLNSRLYVINRGSNTVSAFVVNTVTGALTPMPFSPFSVVANANTIAVHPSGSPVVVGGNTGSPLSGTYLADSFDVTSTSVTRAAGSPFTTSGARPFSSVFSRDGNYYYTGGALSFSIAGFSVNTTTDVLTPLLGAPYNFGALSIRGYATDTAGRLFTATASDGGLRVFTTSSGVPSQVSASPFGTGLAMLTDGVLSPNAQFYIVADSGSSLIASYQISGSGAATTLSSAGVAASSGSTLNTIVFNQTGTYVFGANSSSRSIGRFSFNTTNGAVAHLGTTPDDSAGTSGFLAGMDYLPTLAPTAAAVSISGRVISSENMTIPNTIVTLTGDRSGTLSTKTNSFGYFRFENLVVGQTYIISVSNKRYRFAVPTQVINLQDSLTEVNFTAF